MPVTATARNPHLATVSAPASGLPTPAARHPVGQFHLGRRVDNRPESLATWRVTTSESQVALAVADHFDAAPTESAPSPDGEIEILTAASAVRVVIAGSPSINADMRLWGRGQLVHHCDGVVFLSPPSTAGSACGCPRAMSDRKALAKSGRGPQPSVTVSFRLAQDPSRGMFRFQSPSWNFATSLPAVRGALDAIGGEALCDLAIQRVDVPIRGGASLAYRMPVLTVLGPWG